MDSLKKFALYAILIIAFYFFSNILIFVGLNANYDKISSQGSTPSQVEVEQAEATLVNGRISGKIKNDGEEDLNGKYMKVDLFSSRNVLLGTKYLAIENLAKGATDNFQLYFKAQDVDHYGISFVDKLENIDSNLNLPFIDRPLTTPELIGLLITLMIIG